jgi:hypothetical protein
LLLEFGHFDGESTHCAAAAAEATTPQAAAAGFVYLAGKTNQKAKLEHFNNLS